MRWVTFAGVTWPEPLELCAWPPQRDPWSLSGFKDAARKAPDTECLLYLDDGTLPYCPLLRLFFFAHYFATSTSAVPVQLQATGLRRARSRGFSPSAHRRGPHADQAWAPRPARRPGAARAASPRRRAEPRPRAYRTIARPRRRRRRVACERGPTPRDGVRGGAGTALLRRRTCRRPRCRPQRVDSAARSRVPGRSGSACAVQRPPLRIPVARRRAGGLRRVW